MKDIFDAGFIKKNPGAVKNVMSYVVERRKKQLELTVDKKRKVIVPKDVNLLKIKRRMSNVI